MGWAIRVRDIVKKPYAIIFSTLLWIILGLYLLGGLKINGKLRLTYLHDLWVLCGLLYIFGRSFGLVKFRETSLGKYFIAALEAAVVVFQQRSIKPLKNLNRGSWVLFITLLYSLGLFIVLPILNYRAFQTEIFDLGVFINVIYSKIVSGRFETFYMSLDGLEPLTYFPGTRMNFYLYLFSALFRVLPYAEVFLFLQSAALLLALIPLYKLGDLILPASVPRWMPLLLFLLWDPVYRSNVWDIHEQPFMVGFALWALYYIEKRRVTLSVIFMALMAMWRDDGWWTFAGLALYLGVRTKKWLVAIPLFLVGAVYLPIQISFLNRVNTIGQLYPYLGPSLKTAVERLIDNPFIFLEVAWGNRSYFLHLILSSGGLFLFGGWAILPVIPILALVGLSQHEGLLNWLNHYHLGYFGPLLFATLIGIRNLDGLLNRFRSSRPSINAVIACCLAVGLTQLSYNMSGALSMARERYKDTRCLETLLEKIPPRVPTLAESVIAARISDRHYIMRPSVDPDQTKAEYLVAFDKATMKAGIKGKLSSRIVEPLWQKEKAHDKADIIR